jgi:hypothetical protein
LALLGFVVGARTIADNSFLTHLATGRLIVETGDIPQVDPYSLFGHGQPWTVQSWLVSLVYAQLDSILGGWAIRALNGLVGMAIASSLWRLTAATRQLLTRTVLVGLTLLIGTFLWTPRPLLFGLLAAVVALEVVQGLRPRWWLVVIFALWVNAHGSFVLGGGLLGAVMVGAAIDRRELPRIELTNLALAGVGCLTAVLGPVGWRLLWFPFQLMGRNSALDRVAEWGSPSYRSPVERLFLLLLVVIVLAAARQPRWRTLVPALVFFVAGLVAVRNLGLASIVVVALAAPHLAGLVGTVDGAMRGSLARLTAVVAAVGLAIAGLSVLVSAPVDVASYPVDEVDWLDERDLVANAEVRLAQRDFVGNYLTLRYGPEARVFMDDRFDFHPLGVVDDHNTLLLGGDVDDVLDRRSFDVVLWATSSHLERWLGASDEWDIVVTGDSWFVACRTTSPVYHRCLR